MNQQIDTSERRLDTLKELRDQCTVALNQYLKESGEMCRLLSTIEQFPASKEERLKIIKQRVRENDAQVVYNSVRQELFKLADWD
jgi:hypothetical protein